ncbi:MAG TPA: DUF1569 domain-containing protein [Terracidiphilus sp.]|nr:DUF1569 domain-containing protein [Terracidiphilus sp.]
MRDLFDPVLVDEIKQRILRLHPGSERQWGKMTLAQALAHCTSGVHMAMGVLNPRRAAFPASVIGLLIKPLVLKGDAPIRRNSPSAPELFPANPAFCDFERERAQLITAIDRFATQGANCCSHHPHPFFGKLKPQQWAILMYKHIDHHLRQFGA